MTGRRPLPLLLACLLVLVEAAAFVGIAVAWLVDLVRGVSQMPGATVFLAVFGLGVALLLAASARGLWNGRRWARSPVMTWQILLVVLTVGWLGVETTAWAVLVLVGAVVVGVCLLLPSVVAATVGQRPTEAGGPA